MTPAQQLPWIWLLAAVLMVLGWLWQRRRNNAGIVDVLCATGLAGAALLLASDAGAYINGHTLYVDGGFLAVTR